MFLFQDDFDLYPGAIVDTKTRNQDFVRIAALYKQMGVKNHSFPLILLNRELQGVDPFNPPDTATRDAIVIECKENFWYFIREIARDPAGSDDAPILFKPNRGIMAAYWLYFNHVIFTLIMIRQTGKSFGIDWLYTYLLNIALTKSEISQLTKDEKLRGREIERLKAMEMTLPYYMKQRGARDPGNTEVLKISSLENYFKSYVPNRSVKIADQIGRGMTSSNIGVDEFAYIANNFITVQVMLSASQAAREVARIKNEPYGTIFTTTSGKRDTPEGRYAYKMVFDSAPWSESFLDAKNNEELMRIIENASPAGVPRVNATFNHRQLGKTDDWLRARLKDALQEDATQIEADYLNAWPSGSASSPFSKDIAEAIRQSKVDDYYTAIDGPDCYALRWYYPAEEIEMRMARDPHILSIDPSDGVDRDALAVVLMNSATGEVAMATTVPKTNLIHFAMWICEFLEKWLSVLCIIERRGSGAVILDYLLLYLPSKNINPFTRLYNTIVQDSDTQPDRFNQIKNWVPQSAQHHPTVHKACFGWATSASGATSRNDLYSKTLTMGTRMAGGLMRDAVLVHQILGLVIRNGRVDHESGEHDDMCFVGDTLVRTSTGNRPIREIQVGDLVLTRQGYKPVVKVFCNEKEVISRFGLTGTPNHPFITAHGEVAFKDLKLDTKVITCNEKLSITTERTIIDILSQNGLSIETITGGTTSGRNHPLPFTGRFTRMFMVPFRPVTSSTMLMGTISTTLLRISSALRKASIFGGTPCLKKNGNEEERKVERITLSMLGERATRRPQQNMQLSTERNQPGLRTGEEIILIWPAKSTPLPGEKEESPQKRKEMVYNLMVADCHEYFVNDILVHNCIAWLLGFWILTMGKNLSYYGINPREVLSRNPKLIEHRKQKSSYETYVEQQAKLDIQRLTQALEAEKDEFIARRLEFDLERAIQKLSDEEREIVSTDDLITQLREKRKALQRRPILSYEPNVPNSGYGTYPGFAQSMTTYVTQL